MGWGERRKGARVALRRVLGLRVLGVSERLSGGYFELRAVTGGQGDSAGGMSLEGVNRSTVSWELESLQALGAG